MKKLAEKILKERQQRAVDMVGKRIEVQVSNKALTIDEKNHTAVFVMSTANIDRHGDIVDQDSWITKYFEENPAFYFQHRTADTFPLGKWNKIWFEADPENPGKQRMLGEAKFSVDIDENAKLAWDHVVAGNLNMVSVGFIPHRVEYDEMTDAFILYDCELMECSLVGIGSNRQALVKEVETPEAKKKEVKEALITNKDILDEINRADTTKVVSSNLKAVSLMHKAIRQLDK